MATLEKIRKRMGVIAAIIVGLALLSFILGDFLTSGKSVFRDSQTRIAKVSGKSLSVMDYQARIEEAMENYKQNSRNKNIDQETADQIRDQVWDQMLREQIMGDEYDELGLTVSSDEVFDMVQGNNIHPQILQVPIFQNENGQFDRNKVIEFLKNMENDQTGKAKQVWINFEKGLIADRLNNKYNELIKKGLYVTSQDVKTETFDRNFKITAQYVVKRFDSVSDSLITINDDDLEAYLNKNIKKYEQPATRELAYVTFDVIPSDEDNRLAREWINNRLNEFIQVSDNKQFVNLNSDVPFDEKFYKKGELEAKIDSFVFSSKLGATFGPYFDGKSYKIVKLSRVEMLPDSVKVRHILIAPDQKTNDVARSRKLADSIMTVVKKGGDFASLALKFSGDKGSAAKGGDLGWIKEGTMVKSFSDTCFFSPKGAFRMVETQYGFHIVQVMERAKELKKVQIATLERKVEPSNKTYQFIYQKASQFAGNNRTREAFDRAINEQKLNRKVSGSLREIDRKIPGLDSPRELVRWAFSAEKGQVADKPFEFGNKFVVAVLTDIREKGTPTVDQIRSELEVEVRREKKAELLMKDFKDIKDLNIFASGLKLNVTTTPAIQFSMMSIPGMGMELNVIGNLFGLEKGVISNPIKGNNGIYVFKVETVTEPDSNADLSKEKDFLYRSLSSKVSYMPYNALSELANIEDFRAKFY